jgi:hypothetical protein
MWLPSEQPTPSNGPADLTRENKTIVFYKLRTNVVHQRAGHPTEWASKPHQSAYAAT